MFVKVRAVIISLCVCGAAHLACQDYQFISIGAHCSSASLLASTNLRSSASPFDWMMCFNAEKFKYILETNFKFFTDATCIRTLSDESIYNDEYQITFFHEGKGWTTGKYDLLLRNMQQKYARRIKRFRKLKHFNGKVVFVLTHLVESGNTVLPRDKISFSKESIDLYCKSLKSYFPKLEFTLVVIEKDESATLDAQFLNNKVVRIKEKSVLQNVEDQELLDNYKNFLMSLVADAGK